MSDFLTRLMSGADNQTPAIGRYLGAILFLLFVVTLPCVVSGVLLLRHVEWGTWKELLGALPVYIGAIAATAAGLIAGTHFTEPKP